VGELVWAMSLMFPEFFGGEGGISGNRVTGSQALGITFGPQIQLYYLIAVYTFVCTARCSPSPHAAGPHAECGARQPGARRVCRLRHAAVRYLAFMMAGFFAGVRAGWLHSTSRS
jgi:branched-chain amino acid transport system permease protein